MLGASLVRPRAATVCGLLSVLALAGCATQTKSAVTVSGTTLTIYPSQPPRRWRRRNRGGRARRRAAGAAAGRHDGRASSRCASTLRSTARSSLTTPAPRSRTPRRSPTSARSVPGTSQDSVPITNELGLLQVSPTDTAVYLTQSTPEVSRLARHLLSLELDVPRDVRPRGPRPAPRRPRRSRRRCTRSGLSKLYVTDDGVALRRLDRRRGARRRRQAGTRDRLQRLGDADAVFYGGNTPPSPRSRRLTRRRPPARPSCSCPRRSTTTPSPPSSPPRAQQQPLRLLARVRPVGPHPGRAAVRHRVHRRVRARAGPRGHLRLRGGVRADSCPQGGRDPGRQPRHRGQGLPEPA